MSRVREVENRLPASVWILKDILQLFHIFFSWSKLSCELREIRDWVIEFGVLYNLLPGLFIEQLAQRLRA